MEPDIKGNVLAAIEFYYAGWNDCLDLLESMGKSDRYDEWQAMIDELRRKK